MSRIYISLYLILSLLRPCLAQKYNFKNFSVNDGLSQSEISCICEDKRGVLWFGSLGGGLIRFDGYTFTSYREEDGLPNNFVHTVFEDKHGDFWIGTDAGLCVYNGTKFTLVDNANGPGKKSITSIVEDNSMNIWIGTSNSGLFKYKNNRFEHFTSKTGLPDNTVNCLFLDTDQNLWIGTDRGVSKYYERRFIKYTQEDGLVANNIRSICEDESGYIWLASGGSGVSKFNKTNFSSYTEQSGLAGNTIYSVLADSKGRVWFGTSNGVSTFDGFNFKNYYDTNGLSNNTVLCIKEDSSHDMWFGTSGGGVSRLDNTRFTHLTENDKMGRQVYSIIQVEDGKMLFATSVGGLTMFDGSNYSIIKGENDFTSSKVKALYYDRDSNLWIGTLNDGAYMFNSEGFTHFSTADSLISNSINGFAMDTTRNIWFSSPDNGVCVMNRNNKFKYFTFRNGLPSNTTYALQADKKGDVWVGTDKGLSRLTVYGSDSIYAEVTQYTQTDGLSNPSIRSIALDKQNNVYIGTAGGGIFILHKNKFIGIDKKNGLASNNIYSLIFDNNQNLWVGTELGVDRLRFDDKFTVTDCRHFGKNEGFQGIEVYRNACYLDKSGRIWFGTMNGATVYNSKEDIPFQIAPQTHITGIKLFYDNIEKTKYVDSVNAWYPVPHKLVLPYNQNSLTFSFVGIYQRNPEAIRYKWKLQGLNNDWSPPLAQHDVTYSNLPPGNYTFMVMACNEYNIWNTDPITFEFRIRPPFWKRWWFRLLAVLAVIGSIWYYFHLRMEKIKEKNRIEREKLEMEKNLIELEQEASRLQMNPHFIFNALNSIQGFISANNASQAKHYLTKFARLMRLILENAREKFIPLKNEIEMLENYIELEKLCKNDKFEFKIHVDSAIDTETLEIPPMMIQPFVENSIIHGLKHKETNGNLDISFQLKGSILTCQVTDDGIGRVKSAEIKARTNKKHKSTAIMVTQKRLEQLEVQAGMPAGFEIIDLEENNQPIGTKVVISIPIEN